MSETSKPEQPPPVEPAEPKRTTWRRRIWIYSLRVILIIVISYVVEKCIELFSGEGIQHLRHLNEAFVKSVDELKPWNLGKIFYAGLFGKGLSEATSLCSHTGLFGRLYCAIVNTPYAVFHTIKALSSQGPVSIIMAVATFVVGALLMLWSERKKSDHYDWRDVLGIVLFAPLIGSCFMWGLLQVMHLASYLFGWALVAAETVAGISVLASSIGALGSALRHEREHALTHRIIHRLTNDGG